MHRIALILLALAAAGLGAAPVAVAPAFAEASASDAAIVREAADLIKEKRAAEAVNRLTPLMPRLAGNADFDFAYGLALLESGKPREAAVALRRLLSVQPDHLLARAHLGRALAATGALDEARREMDVVRGREGLPADIKEVMDRNIKLIDEALQKRAEAERQRAGAPAAPGTRTGPGPQPSAGDTAVIRAAAELVRNKRAAEALARLEPLAARLAGNPDFDYVYGVASLDGGRPAQAVTALRRAIAARPDFQVARADLGRALAAMGDLSGARREFEAVRGAGGVPAGARDVLGQQVTAIDTALAGQTGTRVTGYFEQSVGFDTNVNGGPAASSLLIPAFAFLGPATIAPGALPKKSGFYEISGAVSITHPINDETALFANLIGNYHPLFQHQEFRTAVVGGEAGIARQVGELGIFSVAAVGQAFWIGDDIFRAVYGAAGQWRRRVGEWEASVALIWLGLEYPNADGQDADRFTVTGALGRRFEQLPTQPSFTVIVTAGKEIARTGGNEFLSYDLVGVRANLEATLTPTVSVFVQGNYEIHRHEADFPLFFYRRHDEIFEAYAGLDLKLTDKVSVRPTVRWSMTRSNVDLFDQVRWIGTATLRSTF